MLRFLLVISVFVLAPAQAVEIEWIDQPPTHVTPGPDNLIFQNVAPREFFRNRETSPALASCRADLATLRGRYQDERREFRRLLQLKKEGQPVSNDAIDEREVTLRAARTRMLEVETQCGQCAVRRRGPMKLRNPPLARTPVYYEADGSCQLPTTDTNLLRAAFDAWVERLHRPSSYAKRNGGFTNVDEFVSVRGTTVDESLDRFPTNGDRYRAFLAVPGPDIPNPFGSTPDDRLIRTSFSYAFEGWTVKTDDQMTLTFETPTPLLPVTREVRRVSASGARSYVTRQNFVVRMHKVLGTWHVSSDGYLRYRTVADFGISMETAARLGQDMLRETLYELMETQQ